MTRRKSIHLQNHFYFTNPFIINIKCSHNIKKSDYIFSSIINSPRPFWTLFNWRTLSAMLLMDETCSSKNSCSKICDSWNHRKIRWTLQIINVVMVLIYYNLNNYWYCLYGLAGLCKSCVRLAGLCKSCVRLYFVWICFIFYICLFIKRQQSVFVFFIQFYFCGSVRVGSCYIITSWRNRAVLHQYITIYNWKRGR
jgi:hypothetical protein